MRGLRVLVAAFACCLSLLPWYCLGGPGLLGGEVAALPHVSLLAALAQSKPLLPTMA